MMRHSPILFAICLLLSALVGCKRSEFELSHDREVAKNPMDVEFTLRPVDRQTKLQVVTQSGREQVVLRYEEIYSAKYRNQWHIEIADGVSGAAASDTL